MMMRIKAWRFNSTKILSTILSTICNCRDSTREHCHGACQLACSTVLLMNTNTLACPTRSCMLRALSSTHVTETPRFVCFALCTLLNINSTVRVNIGHCLSHNLCIHPSCKHQTKQSPFVAFVATTDQLSISSIVTLLQNLDCCNMGLGDRPFITPFHHWNRSESPGLAVG